MKNNFEILYERIGLLFYAVALRQKPLNIDDYGRLTKIIESNWKTENGIQDRALRDDLNRRLVNSIREAFRNSMSVGEALQLFSVFYSLHALTFDAGIKNRIGNTCRQIAGEFTSNKDEVDTAELLQRLIPEARQEFYGTART